MKHSTFFKLTLTVILNSALPVGVALLIFKSYLLEKSSLTVMVVFWMFYLIHATFSILKMKYGTLIGALFGLYYIPLYGPEKNIRIRVLTRAFIGSTLFYGLGTHYNALVTATGIIWYIIFYVVDTSRPDELKKVTAVDRITNTKLVDKAEFNRYIAEDHK